MKLALTQAQVYCYGEMTDHRYSHTTTEYDIEFVCTTVESRMSLPWDEGGGGSGGGGSLDPKVDPKKPCQGNPVKNPEIAPSVRKDGTHNLQGGRYGYTRSSGGKSKYHNGIDLKSPVGSNLYAMKGGKVVDRTPASQIAAPGTYGAGNLGNTIEIETTLANGDKIRIRYSHLNTITAAYGTEVDQNAIIGTSGKTGNARGDNIIPHVHISVRKKVNGSWEFQNPENYLPTKFNTDGSVNAAINPCNLK